jgi:hypothetical protein
MYSLAVLVVVIFSTMLFSGPIAIALTFIRIKSPLLKTLRRIFVCVLSALGVGLGVMLILEGVALGAKLFALIGILTGAYALKREFARKHF